MTNREQSSAETLFEAALDLPPNRRAAFLDKACRDTPDVRHIVDELLADNDRAGDFLSTPLFSPPGDTAWRASPVSAGLQPGTMLGRYRIVDVVGAGGMGVVYRAHDQTLQRDVAIKILTPGVLTTDDARQRFRKEALALAKLSHPHIAAVYDVGEQQGIDYIVMECVPGESLAARLKSGPLPLREATEIAMQVAQALEEAHEKGVIHRDLKPANVMITPRGQVKVLDFGIAKLLSLSTDAGMTSIAGTQGIIGTPLYMSPEQAHERRVDARTDLWSLGVLYYEALAGSSPFHAESSLAILRAVSEKAPPPLPQLRGDTPPLAQKILSRALQKDVEHRYQSAAEVVRDTSELLAQLTSATSSPGRSKHLVRAMAITAALCVLLVALGGVWLYHRWAGMRWAREQAIPQFNDLLNARQPLAAWLVLQKARTYLPSDPQLIQTAHEDSRPSTITSSPSGASVEVQDYGTPTGPWHRLGTTPLKEIALPKGIFRWRVSMAGKGDMVVAPLTASTINFDLDKSQAHPPGMVPVPGGRWRGNAGFIGFIGPYALPAYYVDQFEVTNRDYQKFVDSGGYQTQRFWTEPFTENSRTLTWAEATDRFRDTTGRPGPATWAGGHYPDGKADYPVTGVSWFEAAAYASFAGKSLPVLAQWMQIAPPDLGPYIVPASNMSSGGLARVGSYAGLGPYGTYDTAGNAGEWVANRVDGDRRFILGGSWDSPGYQYFSPQALSPFARSAENGFRCVLNLGPVPPEAQQPIVERSRDFTRVKPVSDSVFEAQKLLYAYPKTPLNSTVDGTVAETVDWREEKVTFDTGYRGERMSAYLFLPKNAKPPYQTVLFFPSARVLFLPDNKNGTQLGDTTFFDYVVQSGRAVMYPIYQNTYERKVKFSLPAGDQNRQLTTDWSKDAARSLDYLTTRPDIDATRLAYLGVSMGSAYGVMAATLFQDRIQTAVFIDGGYFMEAPAAGADQADFVPRMKKPVLMVNGRYDFTFPLERAQNPFFAQLGTPAADKRHVILDTPHDATEDLPHLTQAVLGWLDQYMGRVDSR